MVTLTGLAVVGAGLVFVFAGAVLSVYSVALLGAILGGSGGYLVAPVVGVEGLLATGVAIAVGVIGGAIITYILLSVAIAAASLLVGSYIGYSVVAPILVTGPWYVEWIVAIGIGVGIALLSMVFTKTTLIGLTSLFGAALASQSVTVASLQQAQARLSIDPLLIDGTTPLFVALTVLGILSQLGLFRLGYVTRLAAAVPGLIVFRDQNVGDHSESRS